MKVNKFRSWNEMVRRFYYFENGEYFCITRGEKVIVSPDHFLWENAEQFTGAKSINGIEIYEGDKSEDGWTVKHGTIKTKQRDGRVSMEEEFCGFYFSGEYFDFPLKTTYGSWPKIIGHIHEDPNPFNR
jgi:hypothetical protein